MRRGSIVAAAAFATWLVSLCGCAATANSARLLNLIGLSEKPLIVSYVSDNVTSPGDGPLAILNPFAAFEPLHQAMSKDLRRQTAVCCLSALRSEDVLNTYMEGRGACHGCAPRLVEQPEARGQQPYGSRTPTCSL